MGNLTSFIRSSAVTTGESPKTGIIRWISKDLCVVSVNINGSPQSLSFEKTAFYFWGHPCEGDMTNLLDVGVEVNVRFRIPESQKPTVVAAWIGDEPKVVHERLVAVYNQKGFVDEIVDNGAVVIFGETIRDCVIVKKGVVYRDRSLLDESAPPLSLDEPIMFDAFPLAVEHPSGAIYEATCAWTGPEPRLVDRFSLRALESLDQRMFTVEMNRVRGTVVVIPNDIVAFAEIEDTKEKILVFRSSFGQGFESIHDAVGVGDRLRMHLASACMFGGRRQLFATKACEIGEGIEASLAVDLPPPVVPSSPEPKSGTDPACGGALLRSTDSLKLISSVSRLRHVIPEERDRGISEHMNGSTVQDGNVDISGPSAEELDSRVETNGQSAEHSDRGLVTSSSSAEERDRRVNTNGLSGEMIDRRTDTNGSSPEKQERRADSNRSSADERNGEADTKNSSSQERDRRLQTNGSSVEKRDTRQDTNGASTKEQDKILQKNVSPVEEPDRRADTNALSAETRDKNLNSNGLSGRYDRGATNGSSSKTSDLKELPISYDLNGTALYREPPLSGVIYTKTTLQDHAVISYEGRCIYVNLCDVYVNGRPCKKDQFSSLVKPADNVVNFEAVSYKWSIGSINFSHYATCVWVGEKPSVAVVASSIWDIDDSILCFGDRTYVGKVENFCFPDIALLSIEAGKNKLLSVVCLHLSEFERKAEHSRENGGPLRNCISDFVTFQDYVEFKVKRNDACSLGLCAYDIKKSTSLAAAKSKRALCKVAGIKMY